MKIETRVKRAFKKITDGAAELEQIQAECTHPDLEGRYESNTGNWCAQDDSYSLELKCPLCKKYWTVYSDNLEYRTINFKEVEKWSR